MELGVLFLLLADTEIHAGSYTYMCRSLQVHICMGRFNFPAKDDTHVNKLHHDILIPFGCCCLRLLSCMSHLMIHKPL